MSEPVAIIVAAVIAGWVAFFSLIISKEQTVSDFRQRWIDDLRKDVADVVARVTGIHGDSIARQGDGEKPLWPSVKTDFIHFNEVTARIRLRLNSEERRKREGPATRAVLHALKELESIFASRQPEFGKIHQLVTTVVEQTQTILKENWKRVRSGERIYRISKWATLAFALMALILWVLYVVRNRYNLT